MEGTQMVHIRDGVTNVMLELINKVYYGGETLRTKIAKLIEARRTFHGNEKIQNECSKYLTLLYDEQWESIKNGHRDNKTNA